MKILVISPVTGEELLKGDREYFQRLVDPETEVEVARVQKGPTSIETFHDLRSAQYTLLGGLAGKETGH